MDNWQQTSERQDPYPDIPFYDGRKINPDTLVGLTCLVVGVCALIAHFCK